jgi:hypothetical protein
LAVLFVIKGLRDRNLTFRRFFGTANLFDPERPFYAIPQCVKWRQDQIFLYSAGRGSGGRQIEHNRQFDFPEEKSPAASKAHGREDLLFLP